MAVKGKSYRLYVWVSPWPWSWSILGYLYFLKGLVDGSAKRKLWFSQECSNSLLGLWLWMKTVPFAHTLSSWMISGPSCGSPGSVHLLIDDILNEETPQSPWGLPSKKKINVVLGQGLGMSSAARDSLLCAPEGECYSNQGQDLVFKRVVLDPQVRDIS